MVNFPLFLPFIVFALILFLFCIRQFFLFFCFQFLSFLPWEVMPNFKYPTTSSSSEFAVLKPVSLGYKHDPVPCETNRLFQLVLLEGWGRCALSGHSLSLFHDAVKWGEAINGDSSWSIYNIALPDCFKWIMTHVNNCQSAAILPAMQRKWNARTVCRTSHGFCRYSESQNKRLLPYLVLLPTLFATLCEFCHGIKEAKSSGHNLQGLLLCRLDGMCSQTG